MAGRRPTSPPLAALGLRPPSPESYSLRVFVGAVLTPRIILLSSRTHGGPLGPNPPRGQRLPSGAEITAGQGGAALPYPPAWPWSRGAEVGSSRRRLRRSRTSAPGAGGMRRLRRPGRAKPHLAAGPAHRRPAPGPRARPLALCGRPGALRCERLRPRVPELVGLVLRRQEVSTQRGLRPFYRWGKLRTRGTISTTSMWLSSVGVTLGREPRSDFPWRALPTEWNQEYEYGKARAPQIALEDGGPRVFRRFQEATSLCHIE